MVDPAGGRRWRGLRGGCRAWRSELFARPAESGSGLRTRQRPAVGCRQPGCRLGGAQVLAHVSKSASLNREAHGSIGCAGGGNATHTQRTHQWIKALGSRRVSADAPAARLRLHLRMGRSSRAGEEQAGAKRREGTRGGDVERLLVREKLRRVTAPAGRETDPLDASASSASTRRFLRKKGGDADGSARRGGACRVPGVERTPQGGRLR